MVCYLWFGIYLYLVPWLLDSSRPFLRDRQRQHADSFCSGVFEHARRFGGGRPGRQQIVDEQYVLALEVFKFSYCKSAFYICPALFFVQKALGTGMADAPQMVLCQRNREFPGELFAPAIAPGCSRARVNGLKIKG